MRTSNEQPGVRDWRMNSDLAGHLSTFFLKVTGAFTMSQNTGFIVTTC